MLTREEFAGHVRDALRRLYDPVHLQGHPLADLLLGGDTPPQTRAMALREAVLESLEVLRPPAQIPFGQREWLCYRLARMCYADCLSKEAASKQLNLSRSSFYRYHKRALDAIVEALWNRCTERGIAFDIEGVAYVESRVDQRVREEARRVSLQATDELVAVNDLVAEVQAILVPVAEQQETELTFRTSSGLPGIYGNPALLRQVALTALSEIITLAPAKALTVIVRPGAAQVVWCIAGLGSSFTESDQQVNHLADTRALLSVCGGGIWWDEVDFSLCFAFPTARLPVVLIIDDDEDAIRLYSRYLRERLYTIWSARNLAETEARLAHGVPDLVLLDLLLPKEDGWDILRHLRATPETSVVPIVVCSVLHQPLLAESLGATEVLQKPVDQANLLQTVQRLLPPPSNPEAGHPEGIGDR